MFDNEPAHTAIHNIESFLWMLGHLIIKFLELEEAPRKMTPALKEALLVFMGDHDLQKKKKQILIKDNHFDKLLEQVWGSQGPYTCLALYPFSDLSIPIWNGIQVPASGIHSMY